MKIYTLHLNDEDMEALHAGLMLIPFGKAAPVVNKINNQIAAAERPKPDDQKLPEGADHDRVNMHNGLSS